eukprot:TRINITY_DN24023_c0_g1_i1.p1 TRINITY_DN24023_c0_g1~~TRINITY_DN24023_c0_g1_i1.p1  ORF type:complete len:779 (+),score=115.43 TRINITY_DN24023_c0_g1_i1:115-2451(+)
MRRSRIHSRLASFVPPELSPPPEESTDGQPPRKDPTDRSIPGGTELLAPDVILQEPGQLVSKGSMRWGNLKDRLAPSFGSFRSQRRSIMRRESTTAGAAAGGGAKALQLLLEQEKNKNMVCTMRIAALQERADRRERQFKDEIAALGHRILELEQVSDLACGALDQQNIALRAKTMQLANVTSPAAPVAYERQQSHFTTGDQHPPGGRGSCGECTSADCEARRRELARRVENLEEMNAQSRMRIRKLLNSADGVAREDKAVGTADQEEVTVDLLRLFSEEHIEAAEPDGEDELESMAAKMKQQEDELRDLVALSKKLLDGQSTAADLEQRLPKAQWDAMAAQIEADCMRRYGLKAETKPVVKDARSQTISTGPLRSPAEVTEERRPALPAAPSSEFYDLFRVATDPEAQAAKVAAAEQAVRADMQQQYELLDSEAGMRAAIASAAAGSRMSLLLQFASRLARSAARKYGASATAQEAQPTLHRAARMQTCSSTGDQAKRDQITQTPSLWRNGINAQGHCRGDDKDRGRTAGRQSQVTHGQVLAMQRQVGTQGQGAAQQKHRPSQLPTGVPRPTSPTCDTPVLTLSPGGSPSPGFPFFPLAAPQSQRTNSPPTPVMDPPLSPTSTSGRSDPHGVLSSGGRSVTSSPLANSRIERDRGRDSAVPLPPRVGHSGAASKRGRHLRGSSMGPQQQPPDGSKPEKAPKEGLRPSPPGGRRTRGQSGRWQLAQVAGIPDDRARMGPIPVSRQLTEIPVGSGEFGTDSLPPIGGSWGRHNTTGVLT